MMLFFKLDYVDSQGRSPYHYAILANASKAIAALWKFDQQSGGQFILKGDKRGSTPLLYASSVKIVRKDTFTALLATKLPLMQREPRHGWTALHLTARWGNAEFTRLLITADENRELIDSQSLNSKHTPLMLAAHFGQTKIVQILLEGGASPLVRDTCGDYALHYAAKEAKYKCLKLLFPKNTYADPYSQENAFGLTAFDYSVIQLIAALRTRTLSFDDQIPKPWSLCNLFLKNALIAPRKLPQTDDVRQVIDLMVGQAIAQVQSEKEKQKKHHYYNNSSESSELVPSGDLFENNYKWQYHLPQFQF